MWDVILDAILDTLKIFPFLLIIYVLIELLEHKTSFAKNGKLLQGKLAPLLGSLTGLVPQCGFSVMSAKLYDRRLISTGTLLAVFLATSDEAFVILLSSGSSAGAVMPLLTVKFVVAVAFGYLANLVLKGEELGSAESEHADMHGYSCGREHDGKHNLNVYLVEPLLHSLKIAFFVLVVNVALGLVIYYVGTDAIANSFVGNEFLQPLITSLVGLIPNCASSVVITETFIKGSITFGSMVAGLCANAGLGLVILYKNTKKIGRNLLFTLALYAIASVVGIAVNYCQILFNLA